MRRGILIGLAAAGIAIGLAAPGAARRRGIHFTGTVTGASISATQSVYNYHDSHFGNGAGVQTVKINATGNGGTDVAVTYYGDAVAVSRDKFTIGTPNANGDAVLTGTGHDFKGTGRARHIRSTYHFAGIYNVKTGIYKLRLVGSYTF